MKIKFLLPVLAIVFIAAGCNKSTPPATNTDTNNPTPSPSQSTDVKMGKVTISITASGFSPSEVTIKKGTTVEFVNNDSRVRWPASNPHPTHTDYPGFDPESGIKAGATWSFTFEKVGAWGFHDHLVPTSVNRGKITVVE